MPALGQSPGHGTAWLCAGISTVHRQKGLHTGVDGWAQHCKGVQTCTCSRAQPGAGGSSLSQRLSATGTEKTVNETHRGRAPQNCAAWFPKAASLPLVGSPSPRLFGHEPWPQGWVWRNSGHEACDSPLRHPLEASRSPPEPILKIRFLEIPSWLSGEQTRLVFMRTRVRSLALLSGLKDLALT